MDQGSVYFSLKMKMAEYHDATLKAIADLKGLADKSKEATGEIRKQREETLKAAAAQRELNKAAKASISRQKAVVSAYKQDKYRDEVAAYREQRSRNQALKQSTLDAAKAQRELNRAAAEQSSKAQRGAREEARKYAEETRKAAAEVRRLKESEDERARALKRLSVMIVAAGAAMTYAVVKLDKAFIKAADTAEQLLFRLQVLTGTASDAQGLFDNMTDIAQKSHLTFEEILQGATTLAAAMKGGRADVEKWMPVLVDLKGAFNNIPFDAIIGNFVRLASAGASAADLFRERGILTMIGVTPGEPISAKDSLDKMWEAWTKFDSKFRGASEKIVETWGGTMSLIKDK